MLLTSATTLCVLEKSSLVESNLLRLIALLIDVRLGGCRLVS